MYSQESIPANKQTNNYTFYYDIILYYINNVVKMLSNVHIIRHIDTFITRQNNGMGD